MNKQSKCFEYLREIFPKFSIAEFKESIFIGLENREIINDDLFEHLLTKTEKSASLNFRAVCINLLGIVKAENYKELVEDLLNPYRTTGAQYVIEDSFFTFPLPTLPFEPGHSERRAWGKVPPGYFHHGEKTCRKVVTAHVI